MDMREAIEGRLKTLNPVFLTFRMTAICMRATRETKEAGIIRS